MISLKDRFPRRTIGHNLNFDSDFAEDDFGLFLPEQLESIERAILDLGSPYEIPSNSDELLRQNGFYDSTDPRSCINKKRR